MKIRLDVINSGKDRFHLWRTAHAPSISRFSNKYSFFDHRIIARSPASACMGSTASEVSVSFIFRFVVMFVCIEL